MKSSAPAKLILSGEHAVVYGHPALAMAVNRYASAVISRELLPRISLDLADLSHRSQLSIHALRRLKDKIKQKYHGFMRGDFSIREVLQKPFELAHFALGMIAESLNYSLPHGVNVQVQSNIPIGCGMGSSAATILSVMHALSDYLQLSLTPEKLFKLALEAERMQHGYTSGLDLRVALQGGCIFVHGEETQARPIPHLPMYLINTGIPRTTTGQCVEKVAMYFRSGTIGKEFATITEYMDQALQHSDWDALREAIKQNQRLLYQIGVVPEKVNHFIQQIEQCDAVAKVCGAGSITGDQAGVIWVIADEIKPIEALCRDFGYQTIPIMGESRGVYAI